MTTRYQCNECDWTGDDPDIEDTWAWDEAYGVRQKYHERVLYCPECKGQDLEEVVK